MRALFELDEFEETRTEWRIVTDWSLCGLCGGKQSWTQGGTSVGGGICDGCAAVDRCDERGGRHVSHWGVSHPVGEHDRLVEARDRRRARFLAAVAS